MQIYTMRKMKILTWQITCEADSQQRHVVFFKRSSMQVMFKIRVRVRVRIIKHGRPILFIRIRPRYLLYSYHMSDLGFKTT